MRVDYATAFPAGMSELASLERATSGAAAFAAMVRVLRRLERGGCPFDPWASTLWAIP